MLRRLGTVQRVYTPRVHPARLQGNLALRQPPGGQREDVRLAYERSHLIGGARPLPRGVPRATDKE